MTFYCRKNNPIWHFQLYVISLSLQKGDTSCSDWAISSFHLTFSVCLPPQYVVLPSNTTVTLQPTPLLAASPVWSPVHPTCPYYIEVCTHPVCSLARVLELTTITWDDGTTTAHQPLQSLMLNCKDINTKINTSTNRRNIKVHNVFPKVTFPPWLHPVRIWLRTVSW